MPSERINISPLKKITFYDSVYQDNANVRKHGSSLSPNLRTSECYDNKHRSMNSPWLKTTSECYDNKHRSMNSPGLKTTYILSSRNRRKNQDRMKVHSCENDPCQGNTWTPSSVLKENCPELQQPRRRNKLIISSQTTVKPSKTDGKVIYPVNYNRRNISIVDVKSRPCDNITSILTSNRNFATCRNKKKSVKFSKELISSENGINQVDNPLQTKQEKTPHFLSQNKNISNRLHFKSPSFSATDKSLDLVSSDYEIHNFTSNRETMKLLNYFNNTEIVGSRRMGSKCFSCEDVNNIQEMKEQWTDEPQEVSHTCIHRYLQNDRLFLEPSFYDENRDSKCKTCGSIEGKTKQLSGLYHITIKQPYSSDAVKDKFSKFKTTSSFKNFKRPHYTSMALKDHIC